MAESTTNFFRARREALGLSQSDIVFRMLPTRVTIGAVSGWDRGQVPRIDLVDALARAYDVPQARILKAMHDLSKERTAEKKPAVANA